MQVKRLTIKLVFFGAVCPCCDSKAPRNWATGTTMSRAVRPRPIDFNRKLEIVRDVQQLDVEPTGDLPLSSNVVAGAEAPLQAQEVRSCDVNVQSQMLVSSCLVGLLKPLEAARKCFGQRMCKLVEKHARMLCCGMS